MDARGLLQFQINGSFNLLTELADGASDAEWTALRFSGKGPAEIVSTFSASRAVAYEVPEQVVRIAVQRFATDIGLTLPKSST